MPILRGVRGILRASTMTFPTDNFGLANRSGARPLPAAAGIGFKAQHFAALLDDPQPPAFVEVHAENYMGAGGLPHAQLTRLRERLPISLHGVGLSIGSQAAPDQVHLQRLAALISRYEPTSFSEHLAWSSHDGRFFNDLLPLCYDAVTLTRICAHVDAVQEYLGLRMLLENPSTYFEFEASTFSEPDFLAAIVARTGCGLLLDVNNIHVSCCNNGHDVDGYLAGLPMSAVGEIHVAGHAREQLSGGGELLIDNHGAAVAEHVWVLFRDVLRRSGAIATLVEWDNDVPAYADLRAQAVRADVELRLVNTPLYGAGK